MTTAEVILLALLTLVGVGLSALFSGLETGLYTINRVRLTVRADADEAAAVRIRGILAAPARMLATILVGNNIANYLSSLGIAALLEGAGVTAGPAVIVNALILIPVLFVVGEILPKDLFRTHTDRWTYACAGFLETARFVLTATGLVPLIRMVGSAFARLLGGSLDDGLTARQRVSQLIKEGLGAGLLSHAQSGLADRALALRDRTAGSEMVPWSHVISLPDGAGATWRRSIATRHAYTRCPVVGAGGRVVGIVSILDLLLQPDVPVHELMAEPTVLPTTTPLSEALRIMRSERTAMAIVTTTSGTPVGLVTLKDLVEPLTGDLEAW